MLCIFRSECVSFHDVQLHTALLSSASVWCHQVTCPARSNLLLRSAHVAEYRGLLNILWKGETHISSSSQSRVHVSLQKHPPTNNEINGTFIFIGLLSLLLTEEDKDDQKDCNSLHSGSRHPGQASYQDAVTLYSYVPPAAAYQEDQ